MHNKLYRGKVFFAHYIHVWLWIVFSPFFGAILLCKMFVFRSIFVLVGIILFSIPTGASAECFSRNLSLGSSGQDVKKLQQLLNTNTQSLITKTGPGSLGNETDYFGTKTRLAVVRFQELHRNDVLTPAGLSLGSGFVGAMTRKKLESLCFTTVSSIPQPVAPLLIPPSPTPKSTGKAPTVYFPSAYSGVPGTTIVVSGDSFALQSSNIVYFGPYHATGTVQSASELFVKIPDIPPGRYPLWAENVNGISNKDAFFIVRNPTVPEPTLSALIPSSGKSGTAVSLVGTGFLSLGNELRTGTQVVFGAPSPNTTTLLWTASTTFSGGDGTQSIPVWIYVVNDRGVSNPLVFQLQI